MNQKPKLSRKILEDHDIIFDEKVLNGKNLDDWICPIRQSLIRLRRQLPNDAKEKFTGELEAFRRSGQDNEKAAREGWSLKPLETQAETAYSEDWYKNDPSFKKIKDEINACRKAAKDARQLHERNEMEPAWAHILQVNFFRSFHEVHDNWSRHENKLVRWELHENLHWNEFRKWTNMNPDVRLPTGPKPDFTYAFPIIDITQKANLSYLLDSQVENFSLQVLSKLRIKEEIHLKSAPTTTLHKWAINEDLPLRATDLICFPWAIVEVKKNKEKFMPGADDTKQNRKIAKENEASEQFCYCQAANASASALTMREELTAVANDPSELRDALVIFSFTCVGPSVKLWVTYRGKPTKKSNGKQPITMVCIWATSLELTWGVMALRMVIKNMREWVYVYAKPEISRWIRMVRDRPSPQRLLMPDCDKFVRPRRAASCEPASERPYSALLGSEYRYPRTKAPPALSRGRTAPESVDRRIFKGCLPNLQLNGCVGQKVQNSGKEEDSEETDSETETDNESEADEGYASHHTYKYQSEEDEEECSSGSDSNEEYEIESLRGSGSSCAQSSEEEDDEVDESSDCDNESTKEDDKSIEDEDESSEEEDSGEEDSGEEDSGEEDSGEEDSGEEDSGGEGYKDNEKGNEEGYCVGTQRHPVLQPMQKISCSPAKDCKSKGRSKKDQSPRLRLRRRSSHF